MSNIQINDLAVRSQQHKTRFGLMLTKYAQEKFID